MILFVLVLLAVIGMVWFGARWLDLWEEERELDWRWEQSMRLTQDPLDEPVVFDQEAGVES